MEENKNEQEQLEQIQSEKDALEAERKKSEEMMEELLRLKAQLANADASAHNKQETDNTVAEVSQSEEDA